MPPINKPVPTAPPPPPPPITRSGPPEPIVLKVRGMEYRFPCLGLRELKKIQVWIDGRMSPIDRVNQYIHKFPPDRREKILDVASVAMTQWPPSFPSGEAMEILACLESWEYCAWLMLRAGHPDLTDEQVRSIVDEIDVNTLMRLFAHGIGAQEIPAEGQEGPKAETAQSAPSTGNGSSAPSPGVTGGLPTSSGA